MAKKKTSKAPQGLPKTINGKKVINTINWKLWYDEKTKLPVGAGFNVVVAGLDEQLPYDLLLEPLRQSQKEHRAVMLILEN